MSRIGKKPVPIPAGVKVAVANREITVEGQARQARVDASPRSRRSRSTKRQGSRRHPRERRSPGPRPARPDPGADSQHGRRRDEGLREEAGDRRRRLPGRGRRRTCCSLRVGFANEVHKPIPAGLTVTCPDQTHIVDQGHRQAEGRPVRRRSAGRPQAGAVQGQGRALRRRTRPSQGRQGRDVSKSQRSVAVGQ